MLQDYGINNKSNYFECIMLVSTKDDILQVLEGVIKYRWNALPVDQRDGMKNYISDVIVKVISVHYS